MKKLLQLFIFLSLLVSSAFAQNKDYVRPSAIGISFVLNDYITPQRIRSNSLTSVLNNKQWAKIKELAPGVAVTYFKGLTNHVDFAGTLMGSFVTVPLPDKPASGNDEFLVEADASANFKMTTEKYWVQPYLSAGVGVSKYRSYYGAIIPLGVGLKVNLFDEASVFLTSQYRIPVTKETNNYHFVHGIGVSGNIGKKKEVPLKEVAIPATPPKDSDNDGIFDDKDKCPDVPGVADYEGCPIPDTDKDGINDEQDKCPTVAGVARYEGCPVPDGDNDGVNDEEDKCPAVAGVRENQGCPVIPEDVKNKVSTAATKILFVTGSAKLQSSSFKGLNEVAKVMTDNPDMLLSVDGHTDNVGADEKNMVLSQNRADAVKAYLVKKGISEERIAATGHGETTPVADNKTAKGRQQNRRSELTLSYFK